MNVSFEKTRLQDREELGRIRTRKEDHEVTRLRCSDKSKARENVNRSTFDHLLFPVFCSCVHVLSGTIK